MSIQKKIACMAWLCGTLTLSAAYADTKTSLPDDHAPIGVMADHTHKQGEWMLSYRYSQMVMDGNRNGADTASTTQILRDYMVSPLDMRMEMHMVGAMFGATDRLTLNGMLPHVRKSMNHVTRTGVHFNTETEGVGDAKIGGIYQLYDEGDEQRRTTFLANLGVSLPTGSIDERGNTPAGTYQKLPYPMQLGSGTYDPILGLTYKQRYTDWSWGTQANTTLRFGENDEGYRLGNEYGLTAWLAHNLSRYASFSFRLDGKAWGNIHGRDNELNTLLVPTARPDLRGGRRVDALIGVNLYQPDGMLAGHRLAGEFGMPVYQHLEGPQLETDYRFMLGWQYAF